MLKLLIVSLIVSISCLKCFSSPSSKIALLDNSDLINEIAAKIESYQILKQVNYTPPFKWAEKQGLYSSHIRVNLFGNPMLQELRNGDLTAVFDNDMFSTGWIVTALLESILYGKGSPSLDVHRLNLALESMNDYKDRNDRNPEQTILRTFWPQIYNSTYNIWQQQPINIRNVALNIEKIPWDSIEKLLRSLKLDKLADYCVQIQKMGEESVKAFSIPPDFDDTYLNLGLGATLSKLKSVYPDIYQAWLKNNTDVESLIDATVRYAFRPEESNFNNNLIDPRTFFFARSFIQEAYKTSQPLSLITTWIQNVDEQRHLKDECVSMPFNLNNVDVTVGANSIYGITSGALFNINGFGDAFIRSSDIQQVYLNTTKFISWAIKANFSSRPDLAQVYYPSTYNFLWYASRTLFLLETETQNYMYLMKQNNLINNAENAEKIAFIRQFRALKPIFEEAKSYLLDAFETTTTLNLLNWKRNDSNPNEMYFCDFLGMNDTDILGKHHESKDDCVFSTAQAINILIATWTYQDPQSKSLIFKSNTPIEAKDLIEQSVNWLTSNIFNRKYKKLNAFFSGSVKGFSSLPFWYPGSFLQYLNGTFVEEANVPMSDLESIIDGVIGSIDENTYQELLAKTHFGVSTPLDFPGYNTKGNFFPFWSSEPYTYAVSLLALTQHNNIVN